MYLGDEYWQFNEAMNDINISLYIYRNQFYWMLNINMTYTCMDDNDHIPLERNVRPCQDSHLHVVHDVSDPYRLNKILVVKLELYIRFI